MVGDGDGRLPQRLGLGDDIPDAGRPVQEAVFTMDMQMHKSAHSRSPYRLRSKLYLEYHTINRSE